MRGRELTNLLLIAVVAILLNHWYPRDSKMIGAFIVAACLVYFLYWLVAIAPNERKKRKETEIQEKADDETYRREYLPQHQAIRKKYDPKDEWNEGTSLPPEYVKEMADLNERHGDMLERRYSR